MLRDVAGAAVVHADDFFLPPEMRTEDRIGAKAAPGGNVHYERMIAEVEKKVADAEDQLLRSRAEFANYKRRTTEEALKLGTFTTCNVVKEFLKVLDNFERAEAQVEKLKAENSENDMLNAVVAGMEKIKKQFEDTL